MDTTQSYMDGLYSYAMVLTGDETVAADLVEETYVRAMKPNRRLLGDSNIKACLYTILRSIRLNQLQQERTKPSMLELDADEDAADLIIETAKDPHALHVSKVEVGQCAKRRCGFLWSPAKSFSCASMENFPIRRSPPCWIARLQP
jgi:DNA-directed RNA polymerase specialized sigma24 family protein